MTPTPLHNLVTGSCTSTVDPIEVGQISCRFVIACLDGVVDSRLSVPRRHLLLPFDRESRSVCRENATLGTDQNHFGGGESTVSRGIFEFDKALQEVVGRQVAGRGHFCDYLNRRLRVDVALWIMGGLVDPHVTTHFRKAA
ncbi:hypothetical protein OUZ56_011901 [Daphnia magna]|uniref:Uncharacterized protein n=1 Tax=Daphnia magna TaxID=35525 RepID=A0ABQ9Z1J8_9CRUS|nr:hypothetical protein OUZ56_011901 [Daphnia magna]